MSDRDIWVFLERKGDSVEDTSLEVLGKAREISDINELKVTGILPGIVSEELKERMIKHGCDTLLNLNNERLNNYSTDIYVNILYNLIKEKEPSILLIGATPYGRDLAGRLAARLRTGLTANAVSLRLDERNILVSGVPAYGGKIVAEIVCERTRPQMATVRPGTFRPFFDKTRSGEIISLEVDTSLIKERVITKEKVTSEFRDLTKSERVVIAGNGTKGDLTIVREMAEAINAEIGVTRPLADRGILSRDYQVGSTGYSLRSDLVVVLGVSGSEHFTSGIKDCKTVISIDIDRNAEIFQHSDYCVVGDIFQIIPKVLERMRVKM